MNIFAAEVEKSLSLHPRRTSKLHPESYIGGNQSKLRYMGICAPNLKATMRAGFSFTAREPQEVAKVWDEIWHASDCFEVMALALAWFDDRKREPVLLDYWPLLSKWSARIDNWAHSDVLCGIYARILEKQPELVYPTLLQWNDSKNPWLRRISMVSLLYYSSQRKKYLPLPKILALVETQIDHDHYYVQKGVGWTLREAGNVYPQDTFQFLKKHIHRLSSHAFSAATEKLTPQEKDLLKSLRQQGSRKRK